MSDWQEGIDIASLATRLTRQSDGIWHSDSQEFVSYPDHGNDDCFDVEDHSFWFRHRNECIAAVVDAFPPPQQGAIFDVGGGNGFVARGLARAGHPVVLVEPGQSGAHNAKQRGLEHVVCATTETAGFLPGVLPAVGLFDVIEHVEDDHGFLRDIRTLMVEGGRLYATVPSFNALWSDEDVSAGHYRRYQLGELCQRLEQAGFEIEFSSYFFRILPVPIFLIRTLPYRLGIVGRRAAKEDAGRGAHRVKPGLGSRVLESLLRAELRELEALRSMRFGGSCLVVARKRS